MKTTSFLTVVALAVVVAAGSTQAQMFPSMGFGESDSHSILAIRSDGSCALTNEVVLPRKMLEMQVTTWERYSKMSDGAGPDEGDATTPPAPGSKSAAKALTDEELGAKVRAMYLGHGDDSEEAGFMLQTLAVSSNSVHLVSTRSFASLKELFSQSPFTWGPSQLMVDEARVELDTNRNLRITLTPSPEYARYTKSAGRRWKSAKIKFSWKLVLPGKILTSSLPNTQETATWLELDGEKPETLEAGVKLLGPPLVITAEAGGLKLDEPLESRKLQRTAGRQRKAEPDLPVTEAGPGFVAEPVSIRLTTVHCFAEAQKLLKGRSAAMMYSMGSTGTVISAKLFPPKGREIQSVSGLKVTTARDDQGRSIAGIGEGDQNDDSYREFRSYNSGDSDQPRAAHFELQLALPAPDARSIDQLEAEAVALTIGGWKEMVLTNVQADAKREIDLGAVLPGARLVVKKVNNKKPQRSVEASLQGPKEVSQLEVKLKLTGRRGGQSNMNERRSSTAGGKTMRNVTVQAFEYDMGQEDTSAPVTLLVRYPQDVKRERVHFKLTALDLL